MLVRMKLSNQIGGFAIQTVATKVSAKGRENHDQEQVVIATIIMEPIKYREINVFVTIPTFDKYFTLPTFYFSLLNPLPFYPLPFNILQIVFYSRFVQLHDIPIAQDPRPFFLIEFDCRFVPIQYFPINPFDTQLLPIFNDFVQ